MESGMESEKRKYWVGFDLGGTKMLACVYDCQFRLIGRKRKRTRGHEGVQAGIERIKNTTEAALKDANISIDEVQGIGVGAPGPVDYEGVILEAVNLGWRNVPLQADLRRLFNCPVAVINDVDAGVYGEYTFGAARDARSVLGIFPGTGIGGGGVYDGQIIRGQKCSCMEIGHVQINPHGKLCGCGLRGCLETEASRLAIAGEVAKAAYRGQAPHLRKTFGTNLADIRSSALAAAITEGDVVVETIIRNAAQQIGRVVANVIHLLAPDVIVMGGGLVEALAELIIPVVKHAIDENVMMPFRDTYHVVAAQLGDDAAVLGAAAWIEKVCRT